MHQGLSREGDVHVHTQEEDRVRVRDCGTRRYGSRDRRCSGQRRERQGQLRHEQHRGHLGGCRERHGWLGHAQRDLRPEDQQLLLQHAEQALAGHRRLRGHPAELGAVDQLQLVDPPGRCDHHLRRHRVHPYLPYRLKARPEHVIKLLTFHNMNRYLLSKLLFGVFAATTVIIFAYLYTGAFIGLVG